MSRESLPLVQDEFATSTDSPLPHCYRHYYDGSLRTTLKPSLRINGSLVGITSYVPYIDVLLPVFHRMNQLIFNQFALLLYVIIRHPNRLTGTDL